MKLRSLLSITLVLGAVFHAGCQRQQSSPPPNASPAAVPLVPLTNMIFVHAGRFLRTATNLVTLTHDFYLGKYEVTQAEYAALMGKNPSHFQGDSNRPVEKLNWYDAAAYCKTLTDRERQAGHLPANFVYRLPTEAEWEYACRAGTTNFYSFGDASDAADEFAWTLENSDGATHPIGQKKPNPWGFYDIHGNVWEWCEDWFAPYPPRDLVDPAGPHAGKFKVFRGGSWNNAVELSRSRNRFMMSPTNGIYFVGLRVALGEASPASSNRAETAKTR